MRIHLTQIYVRPGIDFPFSHRMQKYVASKLSAIAVQTAEFVQKYGRDFSLVIYVSADTGLTNNQIRGPKVYRKSKDVEYSIFLPFDVIAGAPSGCRVAMGFLLAGIQEACQQAGIELPRLSEVKEAIIERVCSDATMVTGPWPRI